jgi:hypothetical protein
VKKKTHYCEGRRRLWMMMPWDATQFPTLEFRFGSFFKNQKGLFNKQDKEDNLEHHYPPHRLLEWMEGFPQFGWLMDDQLGQPIFTHHRIFEGMGNPQFG